MLAAIIVGEQGTCFAISHGFAHSDGLQHYFCKFCHSFTSFAAFADA